MRHVREGGFWAESPKVWVVSTLEMAREEKKGSKRKITKEKLDIAKAMKSRHRRKGENITVYLYVPPSSQQGIRALESTEQAFGLL